MIDVDHRRDGLALVTLDHGKVNALDLELLRAVTDTFRTGLDGARAVVLTGAGRAFSAGVDLRRIVDGGAGYTREFLPALVDAFLALFDCAKPVVAAVNGHAIAGGCVFAAACDLRLMSAGTMGLTELRVGVPFPVAALEIVNTAFGPAAQAMALTGRTFDVDQAVALGLVHQRVDPDRLLDEALDQAASLAAITPGVYAATKHQLRWAARARIEEQAPVSDPEVLRRWTSAETHAEISAYLAGLAKRS